MSNNLVKESKEKKKDSKGLILVAILSLCVLVVGLLLLNEEEPEEEPVVFSEQVETLYLIDQWSVEKENEEKDYFVSLYLESNDYYDITQPEDVLCLTDEGEYKAFADVNKTADVQIFQRYEEELTDSVAAYILIKTDELVDLNNLFVNIEGPEKKIDGVETKEQYIEKTGSADGWNGTITTCVEQTIDDGSASTIEKTIYNKGFLNMLDDDSSVGYYEKIENSFIEKDNRKIVEISLKDFSEKASIAIETTIADAMMVYIEKDTQEVVLDNSGNWSLNLKKVFEPTEKGFVVGYEYEDVEAIKDKEGHIPNAMAMYIGDTQYIITLE